MRSIFFALAIFTSSTTFATEFNCAYRDSDEIVGRLELTNDDQELTYTNTQTGFTLSATLDEPEDSTYFYVANQNGVDYTVVVSTQLLDSGQGNVAIEVEGEPIEGGLLICSGF